MQSARFDVQRDEKVADVFVNQRRENARFLLLAVVFSLPRCSVFFVLFCCHGRAAVVAPSLAAQTTRQRRRADRDNADGFQLHKHARTQMPQLKRASRHQPGRESASRYEAAFFDV